MQGDFDGSVIFTPGHGVFVKVRVMNKIYSQTGSGIQDQMLRLPRNLRWRDRQKPEHTPD